MKLISPKTYVAEATEAAKHAKHRIYLLSMVIADHPDTHGLVSELKIAAKRGVDVTVAADVFTFGAVIDDFVLPHYRSQENRQAIRMARSLKKAGVRFNWLGKQRATLYSGRTHSKWCIIDDMVFTFGGVNMYEKGVNNIDYMFRIHDKKLADRLVEEQLRIQKAERKSSNYPSVIYEHGADKVLIDGGIVGQSVIYNRVLELAEQAESIVFVSQYCPTGKLARILREKPSKAYFNRVDLAGGMNKIAVKISSVISRLDNLYARHTYLHAKVIVYTMPDGSKTIISGSHNYAYTGVLLGTREIAIETKNPDTIKQIEEFIKKEVAVTDD